MTSVRPDRLRLDVVLLLFHGFRVLLMPTRLFWSLFQLLLFHGCQEKHECLINMTKVSEQALK